jgi:hypothetical protein
MPSNSKDLLQRLVCRLQRREAAEFNADVYVWQKPGPKDVRSPCPALNTLANHGYLPHDGKNISREHMIQALMQGYNLSYICAWFITTGGYLLTGQFNMMSLFDLCRHNGIEHNASLVHPDAAVDEEYAPSAIDWDLFGEMCRQTKDEGKTLTAADIAQFRVERENVSETDKLHAEIARGEIGLVLDIFGGGPKVRSVDVAMLRDWWSEEKFPEGWRPPRRVQTLTATMLCSQTIKSHMAAVRAHTPDRPKDTLVIRILRFIVYTFELGV